MGFLIDAVVHRDEAVCCESSETDKARIALLQMIIWLSIYRPHLGRRQTLCRFVVDGVDSQA
jgi:hypothetical protein